jgi:hypothetical protein
MDFMNLNQSAHGDREFGFICTRLGINREVVAGYYKNESVLNRIRRFVDVAGAMNYSHNLKVAMFGNNMRDVAVTDGDRVESEIRFGWNVNYYAIGDLVDIIDAVTDSEVDAKLEELKEAELQYQKQLDDLQEQLDMRDEKVLELDNQQQLQSDEMEKYNLIKMTHDFLQKAKEHFIAKYMGPISNSFGKYYYMLTGDNRGEWMMDVNMYLQVREYGELRDTHYLSAGYQDLIGVCMRLALVDAMYKEEKPFLVLDDPFMNLDQEKVERGNKFLMTVAKEYQVIYFTCHDSRCPT